jgi:uncharacterized protein YcaQ
MPAPNQKTLPQIPNAAARRLFLDRHGLSAPAPAGKAGLLSQIESLGFVQVDSINTVERAHHMILFARRPSYRPKHLAPLLEKDRALFEHWTHDASVIPTEFYPHWRLRFDRDAERLKARWREWRRNGFEAKFGDVLAHIRDNGPAMSRELGGDEEKSNGGWWDWHPSKTALEYLWRTGDLAVCRREGFQKVFDLSERVIPDHHRAPQPHAAETIDWACAGALDRLGFATPGELAAFWDAVTPAEAKDWCASRLGQDLIEAEVAGADGHPRRVFARPDIVETAADAPAPTGAIRILSPFDPAIRDRNRTERLFGFHYRIEVFVPEPKRKYGYYVFPLLEGDRLIGRIDMRRRGEALAVAALWPEPGVRFGKGRLARLEAALDRMARFAGCARVTFANDWIRAPLG